MDVIFDIDGTLANAEHRLHHIKDPAYWRGVPPRPDWDTFLSDELVALDTAIPQTWKLLEYIIESFDNRVLFITGRKESSRKMTTSWLLDQDCPIRFPAASRIQLLGWPNPVPTLYMRKNGDRRPSSTVKRELLNQARADGYNPTLVFEDRADDTAMWRSEGLLCCQVAEGNY